MKKNPITNVRKLITASLIAAPAVVAPTSLWAFNVAGSNLGTLQTSGVLNYQQTANTLNITIANGSTNNILTWGNFDIGATETVTFNQPTASSAILNSVTGAATTIDGGIISNGRVLLLNPAGITISGTAQINTAGFVASTIADTGAETYFSQNNDLALTGETAGTLTVDPAAQITALNGKGTVRLAGNSISVGGVIKGNLEVLSYVKGGNVTLTGVTLTGDGATAGTGSLTVKSMGGNISSATAIAADGDVTLLTGGNTKNGSVSLTGDLTFTNAKATQTLTVDTAGSLNLTKAAITINSATNALETVKVTGATTVLQSGGDIDLGTSSVTGDLTVTSGAKLTNSGAVSVSGNVGLVATTSVDFKGSSDLVFTALTAPTIKVETTGKITVPALTGTDVTLISSADTIALGGDVTNTGTLTLSTAKDLNTSAFALGTVKANINKIVVTSGGKLTTGLVNATTSASLTSTGDLAVNGATIVPTLTLSSGGSITQTGAITSATAASVTATKAITLTNAANDFATIALTNSTAASAVAVADANALTIKTASVAGATTVTATAIALGNNATDSIAFAGALNLVGAAAGTDVSATAKNISVAGDVNFGANIDDVVLNTTGGSYGTFKGTAATLTLAEAADTNLGALTLTGNLSVRSLGAISNSGALVVGGTTAVSAGVTGAAKDITLANAGNSFTGAITIGNDGTNSDVANNVTIKNTIATDFGASKAASITLTSGGAVTDSGQVETPTINVTATGLAVTLDGVAAAGDKFGTATIVGAATNVVDVDDITLNGTFTGAAAVTSIGGNIVLDSISSNNTLTANTILASGKTISDTATGLLNVYGNLTLNTKGGAISIANAGSKGNFGGITLNTTNGVAAGADVTFTESGVARFLSVNLGTGGSLTASAANGVLINRDATDVFTAKNVNLSSSAGWVSVANAGSIGYTVTGNATYTAAGDVTVALGTTTGNIVATGANVSLTNAAALYTVTGTGNVAISSAAVKLGNIVAGGTLGVTATGAVTQDTGATVNATGAVTVGAGANNVTLNNAGNRFGAVNVVANDLKISEATTLNLGTVTLGGTLTATSGDAIVNSGAVTVGGTTTTTLTAPNGITLDNAGNSIVKLLATTTAGNVSINSTTGYQILGGTSIVGNALFKSTGALTDFGVINVSGNATFNGSSVTITNANSTYGGVAFVSSGAVKFAQNSTVNLVAGSKTSNTVEVTSVKGDIISKGASTYTGALSLVAGGNITFVDAAMITGGLTVNAPGVSDLSVLSRAANMGGIAAPGYTNAGTGTVVAPTP